MDVIYKNVMFLLLVNLVNSEVLPVGKCNLEDSKCMTEAFQKSIPIFMVGMPDYGVEVLDIMEMEDVKFELSGLQFSLTDGRLKGFKDSIIDSVKWDTKKKQIDVVLHNNSTLKGHYTAGGRILILPITGDGQMKLKLRNIQIKIVIPNYEVEKDKDGKDHIIPKKYKVDFDVKDNAHFNLTNLFNGNKQLSETMLTFLNDNWKQISQEFGKPILEAAAKKIFKSVKSFLAHVPIEDIANV